MRKPLLLSLLAGLALCAASPAFAQTEPPPPATTPPPNSAPITSVGGGGIGIGAQETLNPNVTYGQFVYDTSAFHLEAMLGFNHTSNADNTSSSEFAFGVGGWYHLARGSSSDLSLGGTAGLDYTSQPGAGNSRTTFSLIPGIEGRVFITPNFAITGRVGLAFTFGDNNTPTVISFGQGTGAFGFTYFFR